MNNINIDSNNITSKHSSDSLKSEELTNNFTIIENINPARIVVLDADANILEFNATANKHTLSYLGKPLMRGKSFFDFFPERYYDYFQQCIKSALNGKTIQFEISFDDTDKKRKCFLMEYSPIKDIHNKTNISFIAIDITDKKNAERALKENESYYKNLIEELPIGLMINKLEDGAFTYINQAVCQMLDKTFEEIISSTYWELTPKRYYMQEVEQLQSLTKTGKYGPFEKHYIHKDGSEIPVRLNGKIINKNGIPYIWSSIENISKSKTYENELIEAKHNAEEISKFKSILLGNINHELRTPLTDIIGSSELLINLIPDNEHNEILNSIAKSGKRLMKTLDSILYLSKLESNMLELNPDFLDIEASILDVFSNYEASASEKNLKICFEPPQEKVIAFMDELIFHHILKNIVDNAIKYTKVGSILIKTQYIEHDSINWAALIVKDSGIGIQATDFARIFDEFRQVSEGNSRAFEGIGIGLSIVKKLVDIINGHILIESEINKGSTFTILLPTQVG